MTDKPTPTDAELKAMWQLHAADIGGIFYYARAVLAKWGQPAPATQQAGERVYAFRRKGLADFCTCDEARYEELSNKPHLFETRIFYTTPQPTHAQAGAVPLDEARRMFDAGWKAAALFCDREDVVADGIIGFGACPQFEEAFRAARK